MSTPELTADTIKSIGNRLDYIERDIRLDLKPLARSLADRLSDLENKARSVDEALEHIRGRIDAFEGISKSVAKQFETQFSKIHKLLDIHTQAIATHQYAFTIADEAESPCGGATATVDSRLNKIEEDAKLDAANLLSIAERLEAAERRIAVDHRWKDAIAAEGANHRQRLANIEYILDQEPKAAATPPPQKPDEPAPLRQIAKALHTTYCETIDSLNPPSLVRPKGHPAFESLPMDRQEAWIRVALEAKSILRQ